MHQAAYVYGTSRYEFGYNSITNISISGAPEDTDFNRWAMLHDGVDYRLYFFKQNSNDTLYQFAFNWSSLQYEFGFNSIAQLRITGAPADADSGSFAMLHDGSHYRLYMRGRANPNRLYQFAYNRSSNRYEYGYNSITIMDITGAPADTDWNRWAMLHDGSHYRLYFGKQGTQNQLYQFAYNASARDYQYGFDSINLLTLQGIPANTDTSDFAMLHDINDYRLYMLTTE
ncbi:MAG: hypothetical protein EP315_01275 [Gammaproteobacteria bacterium]|nr:MAG: hypothetical protein EP315_01275 [Gammaproteobacteria bacterium]